jgi:glutaredoxin 3
MKTVEVFSAGCPCCDEAIQQITAAACTSCNVVVRNMKDPAVAAEAKRYGIGRVPAVVIDGQLADCCKSGGVDLEVLRAMGLGSG